MQVVPSADERILHVDEQVLPERRVAATVPRVCSLVGVGGITVSGPHYVDRDFADGRRIWAERIGG